MPKRWFNMQEDPVILIGSEFWDYVGGAGAYEILISAVEELGDHYKNRIYHELLMRDEQ